MKSRPAFLMAQPRMIGDAPFAAAAERARDKFLAAMPVALRARAAFLRERLFIDTTGWRGGAEKLQFLPVVQDAVSRDRKLAIDYRKPDGQLANRRIDPLGIVAKGMSWYLVANTPAGFCTFRVSRIEKATVLEIPVERPPDFDLATHWKSATEKFHESRLRYTVTARVDRESAEHFVNWRGAKELSRDADGRTTLRIEFDDIEHAAFTMLGMAKRVEVLEPSVLDERQRSLRHRAGRESAPPADDLDRLAASHRMVVVIHRGIRFRSRKKQAVGPLPAR